MEHVVTNLAFLLEEARINGSSIGTEGDIKLIAIQERLLSPSIGNYSPRNFKERSSGCYLLVLKTPTSTIDGYIYYSDWVIDYGENWHGDSCYWDSETLERFLLPIEQDSEEEK